MSVSCVCHVCAWKTFRDRDLRVNRADREDDMNDSAIRSGGGGDMKGDMDGKGDGNGVGNGDGEGDGKGDASQPLWEPLWDSAGRRRLDSTHSPYLEGVLDVAFLTRGIHSSIIPSIHPGINGGVRGTKGGGEGGEGGDTDGDREDGGLGGGVSGESTAGQSVAQFSYSSSSNSSSSSISSSGSSTHSRRRPGKRKGGSKRSMTDKSVLSRLIGTTTSPPPCLVASLGGASGRDITGTLLGGKVGFEDGPYGLTHGARDVGVEVRNERRGKMEVKRGEREREREREREIEEKCFI